jgi:hypothetical protein
LYVRSLLSLSLFKICYVQVFTFLCFVDCASRYMCVMKPNRCTIYLQFIQSLYLYVFQAY